MEPKKNFTKTLGIALGIITVLLGAIWYVKSDIDKKFLVVQGLRFEIESKEVSLSDLAKLQSDSEKAKKYIPQLDRLFTTKDQLLEFSTDMSFIAKQAGFDGSPKFREDVVAVPTNVQKNNFSMAIEGPKNFNDLATFFELVEKSKYFVKFAAINISQEGDIMRVGSEGYVLSFQ